MSASSAPDAPTPKLATIDETAVILHISVRSVRRRLEAGDLRAVRIGRSVRIPIAEIDRLVRSPAISPSNPSNAKEGRQA
jgi:excisionase family DNA binding protein